MTRPAAEPGTLPPPECVERVVALCARRRPRSALLVSPHAASRLGLEIPDCEVEHRRPGAVQYLDRRSDIAVLIGAVEALEKDQALNLVAELRDLHARTLLVLYGQEEGAGGGWQTGDWLGLGMRRVEEWRESGSVWQLYEFSLEDYKVTPDWLSSRYWANPERFGKFRW